MIGSILNRTRTFFRSLAGQIFLLLTIGMSLAAMIALLVAEQSRSHDFQRWRIQRVVASAEDIAQRLQRDPKRVEAMLAAQQIMGAAMAPEGIAVAEPDPALASALRARFGSRSNPEASQVPSGFCFPAFHYNPLERAAGVIDAPRPDCWIVRFTDSTGARRSLALNLPRMVRPPSMVANPLYMLLIVIASAGLAIIVARIVKADLETLFAGLGKHKCWRSLLTYNGRNCVDTLVN